MQIPAMIPELFRQAYELSVDVFYDWDTVYSSGPPAADVDADDDDIDGYTPFQQVLLMVAYEYFSEEGTAICYLARADAFGTLIGDRQCVESWISRGWARRSATDPDAFAPRRFLLDAAATCPLDDGHAEFDPAIFARIAEIRAKEAGIEDRGN
ncbi:hypothetical protein PQQ51_33410 [Paraburkholderia xenovorans]|uniref:hypothetical protein n=1 Tax=Paraburkholderia xenovorans TaxID=36873 RepID=UPI0038B8308A